MKLLLAEDEKELSNALVAVLKANNYTRNEESYGSFCA